MGARILTLVLKIAQEGLSHLSSPRSDSSDKFSLCCNLTSNLIGITKRACANKTLRFIYQLTFLTLLCEFWQWHKAVGIDATFRIVCYLANQIEEWYLCYEKHQYFMSLYGRELAHIKPETVTKLCQAAMENFSLSMLLLLL